MDLSIIDRALRLRDEARKAQLGDNAPDVTPLSRGENGRMEQPTGLPDDKVAVELMNRALALFDEMNKVNDPESGPAPDPQSSADIAELLDAATAPLPVFDDSELSNVEQPPVVTRPPVEQPPVTQPPVAQPPIISQPPIFQPPVVSQPPIAQPPVVSQPPIRQPPISRPPILSPIGDATGTTASGPRSTTPERPPAKRSASKKKGGARKKKPKRDDEK